MTTFSRQFKVAANRLTADLRHRGLIQKALRGYEVKRDENKAKFSDWGSAREVAGSIKYEAINHLDRYLEQFTGQMEKRGAKIFWASTGAEAADYIVRLARERDVKSIIKSKSMTAEEIHLNAALEKNGFPVVESDLGEYIVQLRGEAPYHLVFPAMHLTRDEISRLFTEKLGSAPTNDPEQLTQIARDVMREKYLAADLGITGVNFAVADTGMISITENEGNARLTAALPRIHVAIMGLEKIIPRMEDLALFLPMLATAGSGQALTCYNTLYGGPRQPGEVDGPEEFHLIILDNKRTHLLADPEQRDALHCIRCGACLNVCPIFKNVGGHTYGTTYQGPIGSVITPHLRGLQNWKHLSAASSLCGACTEACPVKIDLHHHLLHNRRNAAKSNPTWWESIAFKGFAVVGRSPFIFRTSLWLGKWALKLHGLIQGGKLQGGVLDPLQSWTKTRSFPSPASQSFHDHWEKRNRDDHER
jgi:L-lactate dehydrogenase complex protein LldF